MSDLPLLSVLIWLPIGAGAGVLALAAAGVGARALKWIALAVAAAVFLLSLPLFFAFDTSFVGLQFVEDSEWAPRFGMRYSLGVDGFSAPMILLNTITTLLVIPAGWDSIRSRVGGYLAAFLLMSGFTNGVFAAADAALFYVFWEATLIPLFIVIGVWGGARRVYAAIKFFLFTLAGSLLMLVALVYLYRETGSFALADYRAAPLSMAAQALLFFAFLAAFAVKMPMTPVHTWLPDAHVEAPTGGSIVLAAVMLKLGAYGFLRLSLPIAPDASQRFGWLIIALSLVAIVYIGVVALMQKDMKKLIAYSSVAHMGFVTLGIFLFDERGMVGGVAQMVSHGFVSGALFLCVGMIYDRMRTRQIDDFGGVANTMPRFAAFLLLFSMANAGLPGTSGFVGEFLVILSAVNFNVWVGVLAATALITGASYTLWMYKRAIFGEIANDRVRVLTDIGARETALLTAFAALVLWMGIYPLPITELARGTANELLAHVERGKLPIKEQTMSEDFKRDTIDSRMKKICEEMGWNFEKPVEKGYAFQKWVGDLLVRYDSHLEGDDIDSCMLLSRDLGVDIILDDTVQKHCYVVQCKYVGKHAKSNPDSIRSFFALHRNLMHDQWVTQSNASNDAKIQLGDYRSKMQKGWRATWIFVSTAQIQDTCKSIAEQDTAMYSDDNVAVECRVWDLSEIKKVSREADSREKSIPDQVEFDIQQNQMLELDLSRKTLVAVVKGNSLKNLYQQYGKTLCAINIREFLGERGINKGIVETAKNRPADFFYFNNGISAICSKFDLSGNRVTAKKFQVINGAQTLGSLNQAPADDSIWILLRLTEGEKVASETKGFNADIIRYNNSQNAIKDSDFRSNDAIQVGIQRKFAETTKRGALPKKIEYQPKRGRRRAKVGHMSLGIEDLAKIRFAYQDNPCVSIESPKTLWDIEHRYRDVFGDPDGEWTENQFNECLSALAFYYGIEAKIKTLKQESRNAGKDSSEQSYLSRLRYHILGLSRVFVEYRQLPVELWKNEVKFQKEFDEFWKSQTFFTSPIKGEASRATDVKGLYNIVRNNERWKKLRDDYSAALNAGAIG